MNLDHYTYFTNNDFSDYEFFSEGEKGKIRKIVRYTQVNDKPIVYNLGFGDATRSGSVDDTKITNNGDRDKILATVANTIIDFTTQVGNYYIFATGSTASRTRLYQMSICRLWDEISKDFVVYGLMKDEWHPFRKNVNYEAFLIKKK